MADRRLTEMKRKQRKEVPVDLRLDHQDLMRLLKMVPADQSVFSGDCVLWMGYVNQSRRYVYFYHRGRKRNLHRLLFMNFSDPLSRAYYVKMSCGNHRCVSVHHMRRYLYQKVPVRVLPQKKKEEEISVKEKYSDRDRSLLVEFEE